MNKLRILLIFFYISLTSYAVCLALSDYYYRQAIKQFSINLSTSDGVNISVALSLTDKSLLFQKRNASALDLKGELLYRQWLQKPDSQFLSNSSLLQQSKDAHLRALKVRKMWVFSLLQIVRIESHTPQLSDDFFKWFDKAYSLGLYETKVAFELFKIGVWRWSEFDLKRKEKLIHLTNASIAKRGNSLKQIAKTLHKSGLFDHICVKLKPTQRQNLVCEKYRYTND